MPKAERTPVKAAPEFSPQDASHTELLIAYLLRRIATLAEAIADLGSLGEDLARCDDRESYEQIAEAIREIVFPELIGEVHRGVAGDVPRNVCTARLTKWKVFISGKIKELRKAAKLTQSQLADLADLPQSHISRLERGQHSPSRKTLERLSAALKVDIGDLDPNEN